MLQLRPLLRHPLQHLHQLQPHLGIARTMTQAQVIVAVIAAVARTLVVGLVSCAKDRQQATTVHPTAQVKMKTWPLRAWIGPSEAML